MTNPKVQQLCDLGQSIWQDDIARSMLTTGKLQQTIDEIGVRGLTSNPTIFEKAISGGNDYDAQITELLGEGKAAQDIFEALEVSDLQGALDLFRPIYDETNGGDGFCSIEVFPDAARNPDATREQTRRLWNEVNRPNLMVKIPGTIEGSPVVAEMIAEGININITLLFSIASYERVAWAYIEGLEKRLASGEPIDHVASVASFFVSRVDTLVDKKLDEKAAADPDNAAKYEALKGKIAVANAKLAYARYQEIFSGDRFLKLKAEGAKPQRPLWASTGTKNPAYSDTLYVDTLIGPDTVNTMPEKTIAAFLDHGTVKRTVDTDVDLARQQMKQLAELGIDIDAVTHQLEEDGIASFIKSFESLLAGVEAKRSQLAGVR
ncbi:MAG TPA: transaldolase [Thermomicrobiales bacterium]|nr:transaldolase [Thermomicrobiales bacterium]